MKSLEGKNVLIPRLVVSLHSINFFRVYILAADFFGIKNTLKSVTLRGIGGRFFVHMKFDIITIFPNILDSYLNESIIKRAIQKKLIRVKIWDLRNFSVERHAKVDDRPYGGGPGMVLQVAPIYKAVKKILSREKGERRVILFSPRGKKLDEKMIERLIRYNRIVMICGRYEGVDERVAKHIADESISIGNYTLSGGELPAMVLIEAISRRIPGVLGKMESLETIKGSFPAYTRPGVYIPEKDKKWSVPKALLSGSHAKIKKWREKGFKKY